MINLAREMERSFFMKNSKENREHKILTNEDEFLEESTKEAESYNVDHPNGNFMAIGTKKSQIPYTIPNDNGSSKAIDAELRNLGLYDGKTINEFESTMPFQQKLKKGAVSYLTKEAYKDGSWFFISGQSQIGKKHIVSAIAKELIKRGYAVVAFNFSSDKQSAKTKYLKSTSTLDKYKKAEILIIAQLWHISPNQLDIEIMEQIIEYRTNYNKVTIITCDITNMNSLKQISPDVFKNIRLKTKKEYFYLIPYDPRNVFRI